MKHINDQQGTVALWVLSWLIYLGSSQQLPSWTSDLLSQRDTMLGSVNLANPPVLVSYCMVIGRESTTTDLIFNVMEITHLFFSFYYSENTYNVFIPL